MRNNRVLVYTDFNPLKKLYTVLKPRLSARFLFAPGLRVTSGFAEIKRRVVNLTRLPLF